MIGLGPSPPSPPLGVRPLLTARCASRGRPVRTLAPRRLGVVGAALVTLPVGRARAGLAAFTPTVVALPAERLRAVRASASVSVSLGLCTPGAAPVFRRRAGRALHVARAARLTERVWSLRALAPPSRLGIIGVAPGTLPVVQARAGLAVSRPTRVACGAERLPAVWAWTLRTLGLWTPGAFPGGTYRSPAARRRRRRRRVAIKYWDPQVRRRRRRQSGRCVAILRGAEDAPQIIADRVTRRIVAGVIGPLPRRRVYGVVAIVR